MPNKKELEELTEKEKVRYSRQMMIEKLGEKDQKKLKSTTALIAGAGGLGSSVSIYLGVAGVGRLKIVDNDRVELSNLNRQILYGNNDVNRDKAEAAKEKIEGFNKNIEVKSIKREISDQTIEELVKGCDLIVDCLDNYQDRYVLNRVSVEKDIPLFHGAVRGIRGQVTTIIPGETPCLRCIVLSPPPPEKTPVLGATAGLIGTIQTHEVIKYVTGIGSLLKNQLLLVEGGTKFSNVEIHRNLKCEVCGEKKGPNFLGE